MPEQFDFSDAVNPFDSGAGEFDFSDAVNPFSATGEPRVGPPESLRGGKPKLEIVEEPVSRIVDDKWERPEGVGNNFDPQKGLVEGALAKAANSPGIEKEQSATGSTTMHFIGKLLQGGSQTASSVVKGLSNGREDPGLIENYKGQYAENTDPERPKTNAGLPMSGYTSYPLKSLFLEPIDAIKSLNFSFKSVEEQKKIIDDLDAAALTPPDNNVYKLAKKFDEWANKSIPVKPTVEEAEGVKGFFLNDVPQGFGSMITFVLAAAGTRGATRRVAPNMSAAESGIVGAGAPGAMANYSSQFEQALAEGATLTEAYETAEKSQLIGVTEGLPVLGFLDRIDKSSGGAVRKALKNILQQGTEEAIQEAGTEIGNVLVRYATYDTEKGFWERLDDSDPEHSGAVGFTTGAILETLSQVLIPGRRAASRKSPKNEILDQTTPIEGTEPDQQPTSALPPPTQINIPPSGPEQISGNANNGMEGSFPYDQATDLTGANVQTPIEEAEQKAPGLDEQISALENIVKQDQIAAMHTERQQALNPTVDDLSYELDQAEASDVAIPSGPVELRGGAYETVDAPANPVVAEKLGAALAEKKQDPETKKVSSPAPKKIQLKEKIAKAFADKEIANKNNEEKIIETKKDEPVASVAKKPEVVEPVTENSKSEPKASNILSQTKRAYLSKKARDGGLKRGSPGYDQAYRNLEDEYEVEMDKAQASLSFEEFDKLNNESPESLNRQAYDNLREEFGLGEAVIESSDKPKTEVKSTDKKPKKLEPLTAKEAKEQSLIRSESEIDEYNDLAQELNETNHGSNIVALRNKKKTRSEEKNIDEKAHEAATSPENNLPEPSDAQKEAGNYKVGKIKVSGLDISIENPKGSKRSGTDPDGKKWSVEMKSHYGYIKRTEGADGDHVDVFVGENTESDNVFVIDQVNKDGSFDEHKVMIGFDVQTRAREAYRRNYTKGFKVGPITKMSTDEFKAWLKSDTTKPLSDKLTSASVVTQKKTAPQNSVKTTPKEKQKNNQAPINDFGEKIGGARKDLAEMMKKDYSYDELANLPLSKVWPKKQVDDISEIRLAAFAFSARAEVPRKPKRPGAVKRWIQNVKTMRNFVAMAASDPLFLEKVMKKADELEAIAPFVNKSKLLESLDRSSWDRIGSVQYYPDAYDMTDGKKTPTPMIVVDIDKRRQVFDGAKSLDQAADVIKKFLGKSDQVKENSNSSDDIAKFEIRGVEGSWSLYRRGDSEYRPLKSGFKIPEDAKKYREKNTQELVDAWEAIKARDNVTKSDMRNKNNRPRTGGDHRQGKDVTPEQFSEAFGFRGVEFGNWVKQTKKVNERQELLNQSYDALMDMAAIIGIPPKAVSLNGELGLGLGSRGRGFASAHFERLDVVINLTKTKGAGSLAHEWFHALDNYFQRKRGAGNVRETSYITYQPEPMFVHKNKPGTHKRRPITEAELKRRSKEHSGDYYDLDNWQKDPSHPKGVRPEIEVAFAGVVDTLIESPMSARSLSADKGKAGGYWSRIIEKAARSFENYVIAKMDQQNFNNDFLANVQSIEEFRRNPDRYPYLLDDEMAPVEKAFDQLFSTLKTKETDKGTALYTTPESSVFSRYAELGDEQVSIEQTVKDVSKLIGFRVPFDIVVRDDLNKNTPMRFNLSDGTIEISEGHEASRSQMAQYLMEEVLHGVDVVGESRTISAGSELFDENGSIYKEAQNEFNSEGPLAGFLHYPLGQSFSNLSKDRVKAELFARLGVIYLGNPKLLQEKLPNAYRAYHDIFKLESESPVSGSYVFRKVWGSRPGRAGKILREYGAVEQSDRNATGANRRRFSGHGLGGIRQAVSRSIGSVPQGKRVSLDSLYLNTTSNQESDFSRQNREFREEHKTIWNKAKQFYVRQFFPGGALPRDVFDEKIQRDNELAVVEFDVSHLVGTLENAVKAEYKKPMDKLSDEELQKFQNALTGDIDTSLPEDVLIVIVAMRQNIDRLSVEYAKDLKAEVEELGSQGSAEAKAKSDLMKTVLDNLGTYAHRSYKAFDDPKWFKKIPDEVLDTARIYLSKQYEESGESKEEALRLAEINMNEIVKNGTAYDNLEAFIRESKLGAKDLSVLKKRKVIAPEIRALLGEYSDPRVNFAKSASKMGRLVFNSRMLKRLREIGAGTFLFEGTDRPPGATVQIAGEKSEVYAPLNGLWTFPEIDQALRDSLGKEQMGQFYRWIVTANGIVKYGKTVLSPTTAARNFMSASFFALTNGHFDLRHATKSLSGLKEYFHHTGEGEKLAYLRKLKKLGVVYDTAYAGEMIRLLEDSKIDEVMKSKPGAFYRGFRAANKAATKFYQYGDDFWKIIGFENEKRLLIKSGVKESEAETEAAERIRNTYPTYSMTGKGINWLRKMPFAGTFVSFPAEIVRTSSHILRYTYKDLKTPGRREMGMRRVAGIAIASGLTYALQALSKSWLGMDDDEEEAVRLLAAPWEKNSNLFFTGRDEQGQLRYLDMSFLDPYNYWKRPINAMLRDQPWEDAATDSIKEILTPFLGRDIAAGSILEVVSNKKATGSPVYDENADLEDQTLEIGNHLRKSLQPGIASNVERTWRALNGEYRSSGQPYDKVDELIGWFGFRVRTLEPKTALYYRSFDFKDADRNATKILNSVLRDANDVSNNDILDAYERATKQSGEAFREMSLVVRAAQKNGMSRSDVVAVLSRSGVSKLDIKSLLDDKAPVVDLSSQSMRNALEKTKAIYGQEIMEKVRARYKYAIQLSKQERKKRRAERKSP